MQEYISVFNSKSHLSPPFMVRRMLHGGACNSSHVADHAADRTIPAAESDIEGSGVDIEMLGS